MAVDSLLLDAYAEPDAPRFRHYGWSDPAFTFGRSQGWEFARAALPVHVSWQDAHERFASAFQLVRRPTGGGLVDHRADWTYALVIPASHPLAHAPARSVYAQCHQVLVDALAEQGVAASLAPCAGGQCSSSGSDREISGSDSSGSVRSDSAAAAYREEGEDDFSCELTGCAELADNTNSTDNTHRADNNAVAPVCFVRAEPYDIINEDGEKLAGAAQKRNRSGLLVQGSLNRPLVGGINWQRFETDVVEGLARWLALGDGQPQTPPEPSSVLVREVGFPRWAPQQLKDEIARFSSEQWNRRR